MKTTLKISFLCTAFMFLFFSVIVIHASEKTGFVTAVGEYNMGEGETMMVGKERAMEQALRSASEQSGVYVESYSRAQNLQLTEDEIHMISRSVVEVTDKKYEQRFTDTGGIFFKVTITAKVNTDSIEELRKALADKKISVSDYKTVQENYEKSLKEIEALKHQLSEAKNEQDKKQVVQEIAQNEKDFTATQLFEQGNNCSILNPDKALEYFNKAIALNPSFELAYNNRGTVYAQLRDYDLAMMDFTRVIALNPKNVVAYRNRGLIYEKKGQYDLAIADYSKDIEVNPNAATTYLNRADLHAKLGHDDLAVADYESAIKKNPKYPYLYSALAKFYLDKGDRNKALAVYDKGISTSSNPGQLYLYRGYTYRNDMGQEDLAFADFQKAMELDPHSKWAYIAIAIYYDKHGQYDKAIATYNRGVAANPKDPEFYKSRGDFFNGKKQYLSAIADYEKVVSLGPADMFDVYTLGHLYKDTNQYDKALDAYDRAIQMAPDYSMPYWSKAFLFEQMGRVTEAISAYQLFLDLFPKDRSVPMAKLKLEELRQRVSQ